MLLKKVSLIAITLGISCGQAAFAQQVSGLRNPLISGSSYSAPFIPAPPGQVPAFGDGSVPGMVNPGHLGPSTLLPSVNHTDGGISGGSYNTYLNPASVAMPGQLGPSMYAPPSPSTPGWAPGSLQAPAGSFNPAIQSGVLPGGGLPGTGGYYTTIPNVRRSGQQTRQYELRGRRSVLGGFQGDGSQDQVELLGPMAGYGVPYGVATGNGPRNSSIDLGGGRRYSGMGGNAISTGSSIQDFGTSAMRYNGIGALNARQSTEFGQGMRRIPIYSNKTTDFGFPYTQFHPANVNGQKTGQMMAPTAVITNF
ncbi:MAG: hypothetical protein K2W82_07160 [Candidatus Obscuribacterales bacterium]|nr:hypothetical protein [Candidatus Obscuribacterales bacterium]